MKKSIIYIKLNNMEEIERNEIVKIEYTQPKFWHRVVANFVDIFIFVLLLICMFFASRGVVQSTSSYKSMTTKMNSMQVESGLYIYSEPNKRNFDVIYFYENINKVSIYGTEFEGKSADGGEPTGLIGLMVKSINTFFDYAKENSAQEYYDKMVTYYDNLRLDSKLEGQSYFITDSSGKIVPNTAVSDVASNRKYYYQNIYKPMIEKYCIGYFQANIPEYAAMLRTDFYYFVFAEFLVAYILAAVLTYYIPALFFKRGRMTLGKALYHIGLVDTRILSPTLKRFTLRFIIFFFMEMLLSLASFGIPFIISFSMMAFSKRRQGFPDYILRLQEIDTSKNNIYMDYVEATLKNELHGEAVDFKMRKPL